MKEGKFETKENLKRTDAEYCSCHQGQNPWAKKSESDAEQPKRDKLNSKKLKSSEVKPYVIILRRNKRRTWRKNEEAPEVKVRCLLQLRLDLSVEDEGNDEEDPEHEEDEAGDGVDNLDDAEVRKVLSDFAKQYEKALQVGTDLLQIHNDFWRCDFLYLSKVFLVLHHNICQADFQGQEIWLLKMGSVAVSYGSNHAGTVFSLIRRIGAVLFCIICTARYMQKSCFSGNSHWP